MKPSQQLVTLVDKCLDNTISKVEMAQLEELMENEASMQYYLDTVAVEGALPDALPQQDTIATKKATPTEATRQIKLLPLAAAAAVTFFIGMIFGQWLNSPDSQTATNNTQITEPEKTEHTATITSLIGVKWKEATPESLTLSNSSQPIAIESGLVELTFFSGVRAIVEGPAVIEVTGQNAAYLHEGKFVANVPKGAEGFRVDYPNGKLIDLGTEFAMNVSKDRKSTEVGVFEGEVEIYNPGEDTPLKITKNHAIIHKQQPNTPFTSIPFYRDNYIRKLPSHEFPWKLPEIYSNPLVTLEFDVSHLIWKSGQFSAVMKWMRGNDAIVCQKAELLCNGKLIAEDIHRGHSGQKTQGNIYHFNIPELPDSQGEWILKIHAQADNQGRHSKNFIPDSSGILLFQGGDISQTKAEQFHGTWHYTHDGRKFERSFFPDGTASLIDDGEYQPEYDNATWTVEEGVLILTFPPSQKNPGGLIERHLISRDNKLIFQNRPYRNGIKMRQK